MTRHIGAHTLARFRQGDLSSRRNSRIRAHLAGCARCSDLNEDLAGVTALLANAQPPPIPEHLSARIQTALAAEAAKRATLTAAAGGADTAVSAAPDRTAARRGAASPRHERPAHGRRQPRALRLSSPVALRTMAAAAAAVVIAGGGYEIAAHVGGSGPSSSTASGAAAPSGLAGPNKSATTAPQLHYEYAGRQYILIPVTGSTNYTLAALSSQVSQELRRNPAGAAGEALHSNASNAPETDTGSSATVGTIPVSTLQGCLTRLAAGQQVLLVDVADFQGAPATVIVTRMSAGGPEQVWVVGTGCSATRSDVLTHVTLAAG
jgi:hypothetical protein